MRKAVILFFILFFIITPTVSAARKISITSDKNTLSLDNEMIINASVSGFVNSEKIYVKGAFHKDGSSNYFGYTKFNNSWIKNSASSKSQKEVFISDWDRKVIVKLDYDDSGFVGVGGYKFKLGYYYLTNSGNVSSINWSTNSIDVLIEKEPSPTPEPESVSSSSENDSSEKSQDEFNPTPTKTLAIVSGKSSVKSVKITNAKKEASEYAKIKPIEDSSEEKDDVQVLGTKDSNFPHLYLFSGGLLIFAAGFIFVKRELKERNII